MDIVHSIVEDLIDQVILEQDGLVITRIVPSTINYVVRFIIVEQEDEPGYEHLSNYEE